MKSKFSEIFHSQRFDIIEIFDYPNMKIDQDDSIAVADFFKRLSSTVFDNMIYI